MENPLGLTSMNHISIVCRSLAKSLDLYQNVLGFLQIKRPDSFGFDSAKSTPPVLTINPKANHISFQSQSMGSVEEKLKETKVEHVKSRVDEGGIKVDQIFFHDPDGMMIEFCNCDVLPIIPIGVGLGEEF